MNIRNKTVLITGGGSGIGYEIAKLFRENECTVIITGRDVSRLKEAAVSLPGINYHACDVTAAASVDELVDYLEHNFPQLDILVNNAGSAFAYDLAGGTGVYDKARTEMETNFLSAVRLNEKLLPVLQRRPEAAVAHVTSITALIPSAKLATYSASKAALHAYIQSLRYALAKAGSIKVYEIMPGLVNTQFSKDVGGAKGVPAGDIAKALLKGIETELYEILPGRMADLYKAYLASPGEAFKMINPQ